MITVSSFGCHVSLFLVKDNNAKKLDEKSLVSSLFGQAHTLLTDCLSRAVES